LLLKQNCVRVFIQIPQRKTTKGTVVAVGNGTKEHMMMKIGDSVLYENMLVLN
jgi:co-chaperonin GroES (HSP10)